MNALRFPKPLFSSLVEAFRKEATAVHACPRFDPTRDPIDTAAPRISEALVIALGLARTQADIAALRAGARGARLLFGRYDYARYGTLCSHGIPQGVSSLGDFLSWHWGAPSATFAAAAKEPLALAGKRGLLLFLRVPGVPLEGHAGLWDRSVATGGTFWNAERTWFWELS